MTAHALTHGIASAVTSPAQPATSNYELQTFWFYVIAVGLTIGRQPAMWCNGWRAFGFRTDVYEPQLD